MGLSPVERDLGKLPAHHDAVTRKLGKLPPKHDSRTLHLADYIDRTAIPKVPPLHKWSTKVTSWPIMLNDQIGDCAIAGPGHQIELWTTYAKPNTLAPSDSAILEAYSAVSGYDPRTGNNDNGCVLLDVMKYWRSTGIGGHQIMAFATIPINNPRLIATGIFMFGGICIGLALPVSAQEQINRGLPWTYTGSYTSQPGSWGGHCVEVVDYDPAVLTCVTWGKLQTMSWEFLTRYCDEIYVCLSNDWIFPTGNSPSGFNLAALQQDLQLL